VNIPPPLYARGLGFTFPLNSILKDKEHSISIYPSSTPDDDDLINDLETRTELDRGQCQALVAALTREFALIQGPPGTGKSYLGLKFMKVLLDIKAKADLGPVIVV
jgi:superfamily II DNA or RNA helicase